MYLAKSAEETDQALILLVALIVIALLVGWMTIRVVLATRRARTPEEKRKARFEALHGPGSAERYGFGHKTEEESGESPAGEE